MAGEAIQCINLLLACSGINLCDSLAGYKGEDKVLETVEIKIPIPQKLAKEAEAVGLLTPQSIENLIRSQIRKSRVDQLFEASERLIQQNNSPLTEKEIEAEIQAVRSKK